MKLVDLREPKAPGSITADLYIIGVMKGPTPAVKETADGRFPVLPFMRQSSTRNQS